MSGPSGPSGPDGQGPPRAPHGTRESAAPGLSEEPEVSADPEGADVPGGTERSEERGTASEAHRVPRQADASDLSPHCDPPPPEVPRQADASDAPDVSPRAEAHGASRRPDAPSGRPRPGPPRASEPLDHTVLKSLLGAWALAACSAEETAAVEAHLTDCAPCADEALRLRDAVGLLHSEDSLDLDPELRAQVLEGCLESRPARIPLPVWAAPFDAETARLDALLRDMAADEWRAPVRLRWFDGRRETDRETTVAGILGHLLAVDGLVAAGLGLPDPLPDGALRVEHDAGPQARTELYWALDRAAPHTPAARRPWREQSHAMIRDVSFLTAAEAEGPEAAGGAADTAGAAGTAEAADTGARTRLVSYGGFSLPLPDAFLDRAFECWKHAQDIAEAVDYPYGPPVAAHLTPLVDLAARQLPGALAARRRAGLAPPPRGLAPAGAPGRTLHLEVEGDGGGDWYLPLDSPGARAGPEETVAHVALDSLEFCQLAAGHVPPLEAAAGQDGDRDAIRDVLFAAASLSRM
ncbi:zf-HC2 domain-containing protein [Streptomyces tubbatahanensis]|uniref:Zf-HC2 domain-containing protein n=1 Tax=Streptomyces tubbatahanensis TaxID=2923272 RepID=A0ABY3XT66_9ACTN|nr:zf-HC2 domain-containing protein [Streptomyces tubbatahanensis]UNS97565.1 zf-HC2 domain-containing protein [Streptomyces tubbatahanensis]